MQTPTTTDARIGSLLGNFRIVRKLGEGGMGVVYEAENLKINSRVAVKLLHAHFAEDEEYAQRFLNEARSVNVIRHRGLVEISDFGKLPDGTLYYVMELLTGDSLHKRIAAKKGPFTESEAVGIGVQIARALSAAHKVGIVHRDGKPTPVPSRNEKGTTWGKRREKRADDPTCSSESQFFFVWSLLSVGN